MVVLVLMIQTCIESLAIILPFIYPDCITGLTSSQTEMDRLVDFSPLSSPLSTLFKYFKYHLFHLTRMRVL